MAIIPGDIHSDMLEDLHPALDMEETAARFVAIPFREKDPKVSIINVHQLRAAYLANGRKSGDDAKIRRSPDRLSIQITSQVREKFHLVKSVSTQACLFWTKKNEQFSISNL